MNTMACVLAPGWLQVRLLGLKTWENFALASFSKISEGTFGSFPASRGFEKVAQNCSKYMVFSRKAWSWTILISNGAEHYGTNKQIMTCVLAPGWLQIRLLGWKDGKFWKMLVLARFQKGRLAVFLLRGKVAQNRSKYMVFSPKVWTWTILTFRKALKTMAHTGTKTHLHLSNLIFIKPLLIPWNKGTLCSYQESIIDVVVCIMFFLRYHLNNCGCQATTPTNTIQLDATWLPYLSAIAWDMCKNIGSLPSFTVCIAKPLFRGRRQGRQPLDPGAGHGPVSFPEAFGP